VNVNLHLWLTVRVNKRLPNGAPFCIRNISYLSWVIWVQDVWHGKWNLPSVTGRLRHDP